MLTILAAATLGGILAALPTLLVVAIVLVIVALGAERFSPDPLITKIVFAILLLVFLLVVFDQFGIYSLRR